MRALILGLFAVLLTSCTPLPPTQAALAATADVAGCWPGAEPPPPRGAVVPTRTFGPSPTATATVGAGTPWPSAAPWPTAMPTATAWPRCTALAGATLKPWPTAWPAPPRYPTRPAGITHAEVDATLLYTFPRLHHVALAVHPSAGWAVVASVWAEEGSPTRRILVRVFAPDGGTWTEATQINPGPAEAGDGQTGGIALAITGDGAIHAAWGGGHAEGNPLWYAASADYGRRWSQPEQIGRGCFSVAGMSGTLDNALALLALCGTGGAGQPITSRPQLLTRLASGPWITEELGISGHWGALVTLGDGPVARAVALLIRADGTANAHREGWIVTKPLTGTVAIEAVDLTPPAGLYPADASVEGVRGLAFRRPNGQDGILFTWSMFRGNAVHAVQSVNGGASWGHVETVLAYPYQPNAVPADPALRPPDHRWASAAYDARSDRVVVLWVARDLAVPWPGNGTHYASWSVPGSGVWEPQLAPGNYTQAIPLITGATAASYTATAHAANASYLWLAWVNGNRELHARTLALDLVVPVGEYPTATALPTATVEVLP